MINNVRLGRCDVEVSALGLGTWAFGGPKKVNNRPVGWFGADDVRARETLIRAADAGIDHWDAADVYGDGQAERLIGQVWDTVKRDDIFLASKVGWAPGDFDHYYHPEQIRRQLEASLKNLATDHIDLYYFHHCDFGPDDEHLEPAIKLFESFRDEGKIRFIGLSDWKSEKILRYAPRIDPDVIQCYRNVVDDTYDESGLKAWVEDNDRGAVFFSPLKHGLLLGKFEGPVTFGEGDHRGALQDFRDSSLLQRLRECRAAVEERFPDHDEPILHALLGALLADSPTGCVLVGQHRPEHVRKAVRIGEPLSAEDARWVFGLYRENGRPTQASWKNYQEAEP